MLSSELSCRFEEHRTLLIGHARLCVTDLDLAEDLAQDTLLTALQRLSTYRPRKEGLRAWLVGILNNHLRHAVRTRSRHQALQERLADHLERQSGKLCYGDLRDAALRLIRVADLSPRQAVVLRLRIDGHRLPAIGVLLGIDARTAGSHLHAGIRALQRCPADLLEQADLSPAGRKGQAVTRYFAPTTVGSALAREQARRFK